MARQQVAKERKEVVTFKSHSKDRAVGSSENPGGRGANSNLVGIISSPCSEWG